MNAAPDTLALVEINVHPSLEEPVVDFLLERESGPGFTSFDVHGHSSRHDHLTVAEQVSGRQRRIRFEVVLGSEDVAALIAQLEQAFNGADVRYRVTPVLASGSLAT